MWVEDPYIQERLCIAAISSLAPSDGFEVAEAKASPVSCCRSSSTITSWQTSVNKVAVTSLILKKLHHTHSVWVCLGVAIHSEVTKHA